MTDGLAIDLGEVPEHVIVTPFGADGLCAGFSVFCRECGRGTSAYLLHIRVDPGCVSRWVAEHTGCGKAEG